MDEGKKLRIYPTNGQIKTLSQWMGHQRFIYNAKFQEDRYFRKFKKKSLSLVGEDVPCDQKYSQFIGTNTAFPQRGPFPDTSQWGLPLDVGLSEILQKALRQADHQKEPNSNKCDFAVKGELPKGDPEFSRFNSVGGRH